MYQKVSAKRETNISTAPERTAELVTTTMTRLGWSVKFVNAAMKQLTAHANNQERVMGTLWQYEFDALVRWNAGCITVEVNERKNAWTQQQCDQRCAEIVAGLEEDARLLAEVQETEAPSTTYGSARWATSKDVSLAGYKGGRGQIRRFLIGPGVHDEGLTVPPQDTERHALVCGPTGSGKTSSIFIPNLIERVKESAIVTEATAGNEPPDLLQKTAGWRHQNGHAIYYFNPDDLSSHRLNPIDYVSTIDQAQHVANLIIQNTSKKYSGGDPIWETSERHLLTALILHAVGEKTHLGDVRAWLREGPEAMGQILSKSPVAAAHDEYRAFFKNSTEGFRNGVTSGLLQRLNLWVNPRIVALTEKSDFAPADLINQPFTFYFALPAQKVHLKPLAALAFNFIVDIALQEQFKYPLMLFLDEFTNFGYIPGIAEKLTIIRHRKVPATLGIQGYSQLEKAYGREDAALLFGQPGTRIFFRPGDHPTAQKISQSLGQKTVSERKMSSSGHIQEREIGRPLMDAGEVLALSGGKALAFTSSTPPMMFRYFTWKDHEEQAKILPPKRRMLEVDERLVIQCEQAKEEPEWQKHAQKPERQRNKAEDKKRARKPERMPEDDRDAPPIL